MRTNTNVERRALRRGVAVIGFVAASGFALGAAADGYGPAGCGLGSVIIGKEPGIGQTFASTTNGTSGSQTFGITSGTSNCDSHDKNASAKLFIETNREALAKDMARGRGETITALTDLAGCESEAAVGAKLQSSFPEILPDAEVTDADVSRRVIDTLRSVPALACVDLS